jgi:histidine triad (HIT) family protein
MDNCIFCRIVKREAPASVFHEDDTALGFLDIHPVNEGHALIVPRRHAAYLSDLDEETGRHLWTVAQRTAAALRASGLRCQGVNLFLADGEAAFQEVFHVHLHVFPRFAGDRFRIEADWSQKPSREALDRVAATIRRSYQGLLESAPSAASGGPC